MIRKLINGCFDLAMRCSAGGAGGIGAVIPNLQLQFSVQDLVVADRKTPSEVNQRLEYPGVSLSLETGDLRGVSPAFAFGQQLHK